MSHVVITGFMGTGKTCVGELVARMLGRPFVDMDAEIVARAGKPIARIFAEEGEARFREMERDLCAKLAGREEPLVIATGGGALVDPVNRERFVGRGTVVCLEATPEEILRRLDGDRSRPLLDVPDPRRAIEELLEARREAYAALPWHVDTTGRTPEEVARRVVRVAEARRIEVRYPGGMYPIVLGAGLLEHVGDVLAQVGVGEGTRIAVVTNAVVAPFYADRVMGALSSRGYGPFLCMVPDGEAHKTVETVIGLYERFLDGGLDRHGVVLALGGGVTGDEAGFAAATFMRGVRFVQVPTTLLAMVDASVGGKTGVDLPRGKNLVGAFKQPEAVVIDPEVLQTLAEGELRAGMAEVIKHAVIGDAELFAELEEDVRRGDLRLPDAERVARALAVKVRVVEEDPFERGLRAVLNLGHTVGHGLERVSQYTLRHGEAVSVGLVAAARIALALGLVGREVVDRIEALLAGWGLPVRCPPYAVERIWDAMTYDKKRRGGRLRWVLPRGIGDVQIVEDVPEEVVHTCLRDLGAR